MEHKVYCIIGDPVPLARPRMSSNHVYDSQKAAKFGAGISLVQQHTGSPKLIGPLTLDITFYFKIPASHKPATRQAMINKPHTNKPDLDNLIKFICDVAQDIIFEDDCIIMNIYARKLYGEEPRTEFTIQQYEPKEFKRGNCGC